MAEGYLVKRLDELGIKDDAIISSGTAAFPGLRPTPEAIEVMKERGIDVSGYVSSKLNKAHVQNADVILVMEPIHKNIILEMVPEAKDKVYLLREFSSEENREDLFIYDPIGKPVEFYRKTFARIENSIEGFLKWMQK